MSPRAVVSFILVVLAVPVAAAGQDAAEILQTAAQRYEQRVADIDNYTVVQSVDGMRVSVYYEKEMRDGHPVFHPRVLPGGDLQSMPGGERSQATRGSAFLAEIEGARVTGTETIDGRDAWVLEVPDAESLGIGGGGFTASTLTFHLDQSDYVPLRMAVHGRLEGEGQPRDVTMTTRFEDYREVSGMLHPFRTTVTMEGMTGGMSADDRAEMQREMQRMQEELAALPPEQRRMMEQQMKNMPQMRQMMEQMEAAAAGKDLEMTVEVEEIRVNGGPPDG